MEIIDCIPQNLHKILEFVKMDNVISVNPVKENTFSDSITKYTIYYKVEK